MIFILILTSIVAIILLKQYRKASKLPPGPLTFPLIGNLHQLIFHVWRLNGVIPAFEYFRKTYGNAFTLWLGPFPHVSIADYETNHEVFVKNGNHYKDRLLPPIFEHLNEGYGLVFANGEYWAELRKFTMLTFRNMGIGRDIMEERIMEELNARCLEIDRDSCNGKTTVLTSEFFDLMVGSVINNILVGKRFDDDTKDNFLHIRHLIDASGEFFTIFDLIAPVWLLQKFFSKRYKGTTEAINSINDYVSQEARKRWEDVKSGKHILSETNHEDYVDAFLARMEKENKNGGHPAYTMESLKYVLGDLWGAGHDTTSTTLVSGFNQLVNNPEVVTKVRKELMKLTDGGSRNLSLKDRVDSHYFNATLAEIQRHASILNVNFWKVNDEDTVVNGYEVEAGTIITAQIGALHANEDIYKDASKFNPDRFLNDEKLIQEVIPFGIGKRSCVGEKLARAELYLMFGNLLLRYDIQPHEKLPSTCDQLPFSSAKYPDKTAKIDFIKLSK